MFIEGTIIYVTVAVIISMLAFLAVVRDFKPRRYLVVALLLVALPGSFVLNIDLLSRARPVELMFAFQRPDVQTATIVSHHFIEGERIYLVLMWEGLDYPRSYSWPWNQEMAEEIQEAMNQALYEGAPGVEVLNPFDPSLDERDHPEIHALPTPSENITKPAPNSEVLEVPRDNSSNDT